jgi:hypothetical protein
MLKWSDMSYVVHHPHQYVGHTFVGVGPKQVNKGQCAALAQGKGVGVPLTFLWRPGKSVADCKPGELTPGTVIATFDKDGNYVSTHAGALTHQYHTALYIGLTTDKKTGVHLILTIVEQFVDKGNTCKGKVRQETIQFAQSIYTSRDARNYHVVESLHGATGGW